MKQFKNIVMKIIVILGLMLSFLTLFLCFNEYSISIIIDIIILVIFTSIYHLLTFLIDKILNREKGKETITEHFIWIILSFLTLIIIDVNFINQIIDMERISRLFLIIIFTIEFTYVISSINIIIDKPNLIVDIGGYLLGLCIGNILTIISTDFLIIFSICIFFSVLVIFCKKRIY